MLLNYGLKKKSYIEEKFGATNFFFALLSQLTFYITTLLYYHIVAFLAFRNITSLFRSNILLPPASKPNPKAFPISS